MPESMKKSLAEKKASLWRKEKKLEKHRKIYPFLITLIARSNHLIDQRVTAAMMP